MRTLIWKDFRINLIVLGYGFVCLIGLTIAFAAVKIYFDVRFNETVWPWPDTLVMNGSFGLAFQLLTVVMLGGCAVAAERADRSAEFLAYLPPSRWTIIISKAIVAFGAGLLIWSADLAIAYGIAPLTGTVSEDLIIFRGSIIPVLTTTAVLLFGVAWCASTFAPSHAIATGVGIAAPIALLCILAGVEYFFNPRAFDLGWWYRLLSVVLGIVGFIGGIIYYVRRVEP